jgi:hypothetical protein
MTIDRLRHLLTTSFEDLERMWGQQPDSEELSLALTVKDFMRDFGIADAHEGLSHFLSFKERQSQSLGHVQVQSLPLSS